MSLETQLRDALTASADDLDGPPFDVYERVTAAVATSRRRRRAAAVGAVAAVAVVAVLVPSLVQGDHRSTLPAKRTQVIVPGPNDPRWNALSTWPARGSLATDTAFLTAVGNQFAAQHILYAADLPTSRVVVTWDSGSDGSSTLTMLAGRRGAAATDLSQVSVSSGDNGDSVVLREHADNDSTIVLLARPGTTTAAISRSVQIGLDGAVDREGFRTVQLTDGAYSELLEDSPSSLTRVKVGDGPSTRVTLTGRQSLNVDDEGSICLTCTGEDFRTKAEEAMGASVAINLGLSPTDVTTATRYLGPVDRTTARRVGISEADIASTNVRLIVTDSRLPQGQVLRSAVIVGTAKDGSSSLTYELTTGVPIDAGTADLRPFAIQGSGPGSATMSYEVFAPNAVKVRLVSSSPRIYPPTPMLTPRQGGVLATTPSWSSEPTPYEVATYDASGKELGRWPIDLPSEDTWTAGGQP